MAGIAIHKIKTSRKGSRKDAITAGAQLISTAQNDGRCSGTARARTGDLCLEGHERICADMARLVAVVW
jgi:hypothetical protein